MYIAYSSIVSQQNKSHRLNTANIADSRNIKIHKPKIGKFIILKVIGGPNSIQLKSSRTKLKIEGRKKPHKSRIRNSIDEISEFRHTDPTAFKQKLAKGSQEEDTKLRDLKKMIKRHHKILKPTNSPKQPM